MKKNLLLFVALAVAGAVSLTFNPLRAQTTPPSAPPSGQPAPPPFHRPPGMQPGFRGRPIMLYMQSIRMLNMSRMELQRSTNDFDGHRQSAIDACDKAIQELQAVQAAVQAEAAKAVPKAPANTAPLTPATPNPAPAPSQ